VLAITLGIMAKMGTKQGLFIQRHAQPMTIVDAFEFILTDVKAKGLQGKAVVNFSAGMLYVKELVRSVQLTIWQDFREGKTWIKVK
jgi:hypothetical protein